MSLYNQLMETDPLASFLMTGLGINPQDVARWRDCYLNEDGTRIVILTRTGGNNREEYQKENEALAQHPWYVGDEDALDSDTYAYFYFESPDEDILAAWKKMAVKNGRRPAIQRMMELTEKLNDPDHQADPDVKRAVEVGRHIMEQLQGAIELQDATSDMDDPPPPVHIIEV